MGSGTDLPLTGHKDDAEKPRFDLLPQEALWRVAEVLSYGERKYTRKDAKANWRMGMAWHRPLAAAYRHLSQWQRGERFDRESGLPHLAHAACNLLFLLTFEETCTPGDDRWKPDEVTVFAPVEKQPVQSPTQIAQLGLSPEARRLQQEQREDLDRYVRKMLADSGSLPQVAESPLKGFASQSLTPPPVDE